MKLSQCLFCYGDTKKKGGGGRDRSVSCSQASARNLQLTRKPRTGSEDMPDLPILLLLIPPPSPSSSSSSHHPWLKECSGKQATPDRRSEALIRAALCVVLAVSPSSCVLRIGSETAFDEYLQRDCGLIKSGNLARYVILSLVM